MLKVLKQMAYMRTTLWVNSFLYYFKRLWLVGKLTPESIYSNYKLKKVFAVVAFIVKQLIDICGKPLYLLACITLPAILLVKHSPQLSGYEFSLAVQAVFFLNCIAGPLGDSQIFTVTRDKITCIKYMHMNARSYIQSALVFKYVPFFVYFLPWLMYFATLWGGTPVQGFFIWVLLFSFRMAGEALQLLVFDRTGKVASRSILVNWTVIIVGPLGAYLPPFLGLNWNMDVFLLNPVTVACFAAIGCVCAWYIMTGYRHYETKLHRSIDLNFLFSTMMKAGSVAAFKDVEVKEKDVTISEAANKKFRSLKGYAYINALFFARHRRQLMKPVLYRSIAAAVILIAAVVFAITSREAAVWVSENLTSLLPALIFIMYFMTVADKACRAMFYNCDKDMLHYAHYRQPHTILKTFRIRLFRVSLYDLILAAVICLAAAVFCLICGTNIFTWDMLLFCMAAVLLSILFTAHHLCMYYIFQPYSESLKVKNPFFMVVNSVMYILCLLCLKIDAGGAAFTTSVFIFTIVYIAAALALVYKRAPISFRVK